VHTELYPITKAISPRLTTCVFSEAENLGRFYDPPGMYHNSISSVGAKKIRSEIT